MLSFFSPRRVQDHDDTEKSLSFQGHIRAADQCKLQIVHDTNKIIDNIVQGYCPIELERVFIFVENTRTISAEGAIKLLCNFDTPETLEFGTQVTPAAQILMRICTGTDGTKKMGTELRALRDSGEYDSLELAIPAIIELAIKRSECSIEDTDSLSKKYKVWLKGCKWTDCDYPPYPWDYLTYMSTKSLYNGVFGRNISTAFENLHPMDIVGIENLGLFQLIWTRPRGKLPRLQENVFKSIQMGLDYNRQIKHAQRRVKENAHKRHKKKHGGDSMSCVLS